MTTTDDRDLPALHARLAEILGKTVEEVEAMTREDIMEATARISFQGTGLEIANRFEAAADMHLMDEGPREQAARATGHLERLHARLPLFPVRTQHATVDLFGFGRAPVHYVTQADDEDGDHTQYLLLSELAEPLGIPLGRAHDWARQEEVDSLRAQRERDEETGTVGWECLNDVVDLGIWATVDDPEAKPDADGKRWSYAGEWLVSDDRILSLMTVSPWNAEFLSNAKHLFGHAFRNTMGDALKGVPTYTADGTPTGTSAYDLLADTGGLSVEEARRRAMRGLDLGEA